MICLFEDGIELLCCLGLCSILREVECFHLLDCVVGTLSQDIPRDYKTFQSDIYIHIEKEALL